MTKELVKISSANDLKLFLATNYMAQIKNFFGDDKQAMKFLSSVMADVQKTPKLMECNPMTLVNSYITMAQLGLMPSGISGEAYVLPYGGEAQFQLGYQGLVTLFYRAGGTSLRAEIVRKNDEFSYENGAIHHKIDIFKSNEERGEAVGAYAIANVNGHEIVKAMNSKDIIGMGVRFSKSYNATGKYSPWNPDNDLELNMWKKTVLKQLGKMLPKNETIYKAISEDDRDSVLSDRLEKTKGSSNSLKMGNVLINDKDQNQEATDQPEGTNAPADQG